MTNEQRPPTRPQSEYGDRPAGAPSQPPREAERFSAGSEQGDVLDAHRADVLQALNAAEELDTAAIAERVPLRDTQVSSLMKRLEHDGAVTRTAEQRWRLTPGARQRLEA